MNASPILITGATGWLGRRFVDVILNGLPELPQEKPKFEGTLRCIVPHNVAGKSPANQNIVFVPGDLRNQSDCDDLCAGTGSWLLFHIAGVIHPSRIREFYEVNVEGTRNILRSAVKAGVRRAVVVSSNSPFGNNPARTHRFDENSPFNPYRNYGRSKMLMEQVVREFQETGKLETVILRAPWFYGPFQPPRQTVFFRMIRDGKCPIVGDGNNHRSMVYIDHLCQALIKAALVERANGKAYWIADERPYTMNEIVDTVERLLEQEFHIPCAHKRIRLPAIAATIAEFLDAAIQGAGLYNQRIHVLSEMDKTIACSIEKAKIDLEYRPFVDLEEGMRRSIRYCVENSVL